MLVFLKILLIIVSIALIVGVLLQSGNGAGGLGSLAGGGGSPILGGNGKALDGLLSKVTTVAAILFMVLALVVAAVQ